MVMGSPAQLPRWFGWLLAVVGGLLFGFNIFLYVFAGLAAGGFATDEGSLTLIAGFALIGLLGFIAGIRIVRAHAR
jgi:hypothetical protein